MRGFIGRHNVIYTFLATPLILVSAFLSLNMVAAQLGIRKQSGTYQNQRGGIGGLASLRI
jgi:hypothetical protein